MKTLTLGEFVRIYGRRYSEELGISLTGGDEEEIFKWFLASLLFGAPIKESSAANTYRVFARRNVVTPWRILEAGWEGLVELLDEGGYTRYDFKTADKLLLIARNLVETYLGSLNRLHEAASDPRDLERRLKGLGKGVGDVTVSIFLRELRGLWSKADAFPTGLIVLAGERLGVLDRDVSSEEALKRLKAFWAEKRVGGELFASFETALLRFGKDVCRKKECNVRLVST